MTGSRILNPCPDTKAIGQQQHIAASSGQGGVRHRARSHPFLGSAQLESAEVLEINGDISLGWKSTCMKTYCDCSNCSVEMKKKSAVPAHRQPATVTRVEAGVQIGRTSLDALTIRLEQLADCVDCKAVSAV